MDRPEEVVWHSSLPLSCVTVHGKETVRVVVAFRLVLTTWCFFFCATGSQQWLLGLSLSIVEVFSSVFVALHDEYECGLLVRPEG